MRTYAIWNGTGELQPGEAYWVLLSGRDSGRIVGRKYVRARVRAYLAKMKRYNLLRIPVEEVLANTVDNDQWLYQRNGYVVAALARDAYDDYSVRRWERI